MNAPSVVIAGWSLHDVRVFRIVAWTGIHVVNPDVDPKRYGLEDVFARVGNGEVAHQPVVLTVAGRTAHVVDGALGEILRPAPTGPRRGNGKSPLPPGMSQSFNHTLRE